MSSIHTIAIHNEVHVAGTVSSTRKSEGRRYVACVVGTATEDTVKFLKAENARRKALPKDNFLHDWMLDVPAVGSQGVFSWHTTLDGAMKGLRGWETQGYGREAPTAKGYSSGERQGYGWHLVIRTDVTVRETAKKAPKST